MLRFEILDSEQGVNRFVELQTFPIRIGKLSASELHIDDANVSRIHARIEKNGDAYRLVDLGSANGSFANQKKLMTHTLKDGDVLTFGKVSMRVSMLVPTPDLNIERAVGLAVPSLPSVPPNQVRSMMQQELPKFRAPMTASSTPAGSGFFAGQKPKVLHKKKKEVSYERRFLSQRAKGKNGMLELAMIWRGDVVSVDQYKAKAGTSISMGVGPKCNYRLDDKRVGHERVFLYCKDDGQWELHFNQSMDGFVLVDPKEYGVERIAFSEASGAAFGLPTQAGIVELGTKAIELSGQTRAKFVFGEVTILVHFTDAVPLALAQPAFFSITKWTSFGGLAASLLIHFFIFSMFLFATSRVDALMVDRILTSTRFGEAIFQPLEIEVPDVDEPDEVLPPEELVDNDDRGDVSDTPFVRSDTSGSTFSASESVAIAKQTGLLAQTNVINSMLTAGMDIQRFDNLDWDHFDNSMAATNNTYGLDMIGGGGPVVGAFTGTFGPNSGPGNHARRTVRAPNIDLGPPNHKPIVFSPPRSIDVTGSLEKRVIQRVVRQHSNELKACYEREVTKVKGLKGRLDVTWIIAVNGSVAKVYLNASTLKNKNVEDCVLNSIKFWRFPTPKGAGMVQINYPFVFDLGANE